MWVSATAASRRASDLCRQMLAYSGKGRFVIEPIDLDALLEGRLARLESSSDTHELVGAEKCFGPRPESPPI